MVSTPTRRGPKAADIRRAGAPGPAPAPSLDWEGTRIFLEVARHGSLRAASLVLNLSVNALRRKLDNLERGLGVTLITRHVDGIRLTHEGERVRIAAERMEAASFDVVRRSDSRDEELAGEVRLAATEGLGTFWIAPRIQDFQTRNPGVTVNLHCAMPKVDVLRLEADVAVQLKRPEEKDLKIVKLARLHVMPFAAPSYVAKYGMPQSTEDLARHRLVALIADQVKSAEEVYRQTRRDRHVGRIVLRTDGSSANYCAIADGGGIGWLPTYAAMIDSSLIPMDYGDRFSQSVWLVYHQDAARIARVRELISWLTEIFSPQKYPWFADEFIHPSDFPKPEGFTGVVRNARVRLAG